MASEQAREEAEMWYVEYRMPSGEEPTKLWPESGYRSKAECEWFAAYIEKNGCIDFAIQYYDPFEA